MNKVASMLINPFTPRPAKTGHFVILLCLSHCQHPGSNKSTITDKQEKEHSNQLKNSTVRQSFKYCKCKPFLHLMSPCFYMYCISTNVSSNLVI